MVGILEKMVIHFCCLNRMDMRDDVFEMICFDKIDRLMANRRTDLGLIVAWHIYYIWTVVPEHNVAPPEFHFRLH